VFKDRRAAPRKGRKAVNIRKPLLILMALLVFGGWACPALGAEGFGVTVQFLAAGYSGPEKDLWQYELQRHTSMGLYRYELADGKASVPQRICANPSLYPAIEPNGKRIVFYRQNTKFNATSPEAGTRSTKEFYRKNLTAQTEGDAGGRPDRTWRLSICNADGSGLRDLVDFGEANLGQARLDWTADGWIYYSYPDPKVRDGKRQIWRINPDNPKQHEYVLDLDPRKNGRTNLQRFSLNLAGTRLAIRQHGGGYGGNDGYLDWPPKGHRVGNRAKTIGYACDRQHGSCIRRCMVQVMASGDYLVSFPGYDHKDLLITRWDTDKNEIRKERFIHWEQMQKWPGASGECRSSHFIRAAVNSDKWIILMRQRNVKLVNWIDERIIMVRHNEHNLFGRFAKRIAQSPGDLWIRGPAGKYQTVEGKWVAPGTRAAEAPRAQANGKTGAKKRSVSARKAQAQWPRHWKGAEFYWSHLGENQIDLPDAEEEMRECQCEPRGYARFTRSKGMWTADGMFRGEAGEAPLLEQCRKSNEFTIEFAYEADQPEHKGPAGRLISFSQGPDKRNFTIAQHGTNLVLWLATSKDPHGGGKPVVLCPASADAYQHVVVTYREGDLRCFVNGRKQQLAGTVRGDLSAWTPGKLLFGAEWDWSHHWSGAIEGVMLRSIALPDDDVAASYGAFAPRLRKQPIPQIKLRAELVGKTQWQMEGLGITRVYPRLLVVYRYKVNKVLQGDYRHSHVNVAHWGALDRAYVAPIRQRKVGGSYRLVLEDFKHHPEVEAEEQICGVEGDLDMPLMLDVADLGLPPRTTEPTAVDRSRAGSEMKRAASQ
jgi:hypothetical protein